MIRLPGIIDVPSYVVSLPSKGKIYEKDSCFHDSSDAEFKIMTAKQEDILMDPATRKKGRAVVSLLKSCMEGVTEEDIKKMLIGDKDALIIAIRVSGYGDVYEPTFECPNCEEDITAQIPLSKIKINSLSIEPSEKGSNSFSCVLPLSGKTIEFRFLTVADEQDIELEEETRVTSTLKRHILTIDGKTDRDFISHYVDNMKVSDSKFLRNYIEKNQPSLDLSCHVECVHCEKMIHFNLPKNEDFFSIRPEHREEVLLEPFFNLAYYFGMSWETYHSFPVSYRRWIMERLNKEIKQAQDRGENPQVSKAHHHNDPELRQLMGKTHPHAPPNLRKF